MRLRVLLGAAAAVLYSRLLQAENEGDDEEIKAAMGALLRALVRINFCYSREHFLMLDVPEDGVKWLLEQTTESAAEGARKRKGLKVKLPERQLLLDHSYRRTTMCPAGPLKENKEALARSKYDEVFFRESARPSYLFVVTCALMVALASADWSVGVLVCRALAGVVVAFVAQRIYNATCTPRARPRLRRLERQRLCDHRHHARRRRAHAYAGRPGSYPVARRPGGAPAPRGTARAPPPGPIARRPDCGPVPLGNARAPTTTGPVDRRPGGAPVPPGTASAPVPPRTARAPPGTASSPSPRCTARAVGLIWDVVVVVPRGAQALRQQRGGGAGLRHVRRQQLGCGAGASSRPPASASRRAPRAVSYASSSPARSWSPARRSTA